MMGDANWDEYHPLKAQLEKLGHVDERTVYIDLHGMKDGHGADVIIGCGNGSPAAQGARPSYRRPSRGGQGDDRSRRRQARLRRDQAGHDDIVGAASGRDRDPVGDLPLVPRRAECRQVEGTSDHRSRRRAADEQRRIAARPAPSDLDWLVA